MINQSTQHELGKMRQEISMTQETLQAAICAIDAVESTGIGIKDNISREEHLQSMLPDARTIIARAFERFEHRVTEEDACSFRSTTLEDVWAAVREIDKEQRERQCAQNMRRIEPLLYGFEKYVKVIDIPPGDIPFMQYLWVSAVLS